MYNGEKFSLFSDHSWAISLYHNEFRISMSNNSTILISVNSWNMFTSEVYNYALYNSLFFLKSISQIKKETNCTNYLIGDVYIRLSREKHLNHFDEIPSCSKDQRCWCILKFKIKEFLSLLLIAFLNNSIKSSYYNITNDVFNALFIFHFISWTTLSFHWNKKWNNVPVPKKTSTTRIDN